MSDYSTLKVPELKKLLQEKSLPVAGNKADLIARLQEHDKSQEPAQPEAAKTTADDEIDWDDDDPATTTTTTAAAKPAEPGPAESAPAPAVEEPQSAAAAETTQDAPAASTTETTAEVPAKEEPAAPKPDFSAHLAASSADEEARKRAERAKRFGIVVDENEEEKKKAERAQRFGAEEPAVAVVKGLDSALPERRERKRGREGAGGGEQRDAKRQSTDGRRGGAAPGGRGRGRDRRRQGGAGAGRAEGKPSGGAQKASILTDPTEKAKAEARAKRFGA
ncbi:sap domain-containing protein [Seiridium cupressi]